jgi:tRNA-dihydrouridine synthase 1
MPGKKRPRPSGGELPSPTAVSLPPPRKPLPPHQLILAPMVGGSELAFRLLARRWGAQLCYTPMIKSEDFFRKGNGVNLLEVHADDAPLVAHFSGNDPAKLLAVAKRTERCHPGVAAIDLNLGCPQRSAHSGHFGAFLCVKPADRERVLGIVSILARSLRIPVFCKIRLLDDGIDETVRFAQQLERAGCALLAVHGRYRGSPMHRRDGPAHLDQIRQVKAALAIPTITNGNVRSAKELISSLQETHCDGVMSAEGALDDPTIFQRASEELRGEREELRRAVKRAKALKVEKRASGRKLDAQERALVKGRRAAKERLRSLPPSLDLVGSASSSASAAWSSEPLDLALQYLDLVALHPPPPASDRPGDKDALMRHTIFHVRRLCRDLLTRYELLEPLKVCTSLDGVRELLGRCREYAEGRREFVEGVEAVELERTALAARKAANSARRAEYVERMLSRARKEGLADERFYLRQGEAPPSHADLEHARRMGKDAQARWWRERFGQHCQGHHIDGVCPHLHDSRGCGFLHGGDEDERV